MRAITERSMKKLIREKKETGLAMMKLAEIRSESVYLTWEQLTHILADQALEQRLLNAIDPRNAE